MIQKAETFAMTVLLIAACCSLALGQVLPPTILEIDIENVVEYQNDISDLSKVATNPNITPGRAGGTGTSSIPRNFSRLSS